MANILKKSVLNLVEKAILQSGTVLDTWHTDTLCELVLHLPATDMARWNTIPRIKCKVAEYEYRDYTPATWNATERVCTVLVETGHNGAGSTWAKRLNVGDTVLYSPAHAAQLPSRPGPVLALGDGSALGHFLALKQLTDRTQHPFEAIVCFQHSCTVPPRVTADNPEIEYSLQHGASSLPYLQRQAAQKPLHTYTSIYISGHIPMVQGLRKFLKQQPGFQARLFAHGFWS